MRRNEVADAFLPTDNRWGIPVLNAHRQAQQVDLPVQLWGSVARTKRMVGTWLFYTEDRHFRALWDNPAPIVTSGCVAVAEPNFSIYEDTPMVVAAHQIYKKRWLARFWQDHGIRTLVDLNVFPRFARLNLLGVPKGWRSYITRGYTSRLDATEAEYELATRHAGSPDILFTVYGGGRQVRQRCYDRGWLWIPERMDVVNDRPVLYG